MTNKIFRRFVIYFGNRLIAYGIRFPSGQHVVSLSEKNETRIYDDAVAFENSLRSMMFVTWLDGEENTILKSEAENDFD